MQDNECKSVSSGILQKKDSLYLSTIIILSNFKKQTRLKTGQIAHIYSIIVENVPNFISHLTAEDLKFETIRNPPFL